MNKILMSTINTNGKQKLGIVSSESARTKLCNVALFPFFLKPSAPPLPDINEVISIYDYVEY